VRGAVVDRVFGLRKRVLPRLLQCAQLVAADLQQLAVSRLTQLLGRLGGVLAACWAAFFTRAAAPCTAPCAFSRSSCAAAARSFSSIFYLLNTGSRTLAADDWRNCGPPALPAHSGPFSSIKEETGERNSFCAAGTTKGGAADAVPRCFAAARAQCAAEISKIS